jgi:uncharacterized protein (DUF4415 family)
MKPKLKLHSLREDEEITRAIASDPDTMEITDEIAATMRPLAQTNPALLARIEAAQAQRGRPKGATKRVVSLSLDGELIDALRASGKGWQTRVNAILRSSMGF